MHDPDRPAPKRITPVPAPAQPAPPPSDAIVLFNGRDLSQWQPSDWKLVDGCVEAVTGTLTTKEQFGSYQLHLEWQAPNPPSGPWYNRGNNGVLLMGLYEVQIFDSYTEKIYPDGQAAAIYAQTPPLVNATRPPGEWEVYDLVFTPPVYENGQQTKPARLTMFHNGVLVHLNQEIYGETNHRVLPEHKHKISRGPLSLGAHHCPVRFRNIWLRTL